MKKVLYSILALISAWTLTAQTYTQTYTTGDIFGVTQVQTSTAQVSPCPGILTFTNIPAGVNVDSILVVYDFFSTMAGFQSPFDQRSYINCPTTGQKEATLALAPPTGPGQTTVTYSRVLSVANGPITGNLVIELHAGTTALIPGSCTGSGHIVMNNTFSVTVYTSGSAACPNPTALSVTPTTNSADFDWTPGGTETTWEIRHGLEGSSVSGMAAQIVTSHPTTISSLDSATSYDFYVRAACGSGDTSQWSGPFTAMTDTPVCAMPTDGLVTGVTETEATVAWQQGGFTTDWDLEYGPQGFTLGSGTMISGAQSNPWILQGLTPDTDYEVYIRNNCVLNKSDWLGPLGFTTLDPTVGLTEEKDQLRLYPNPAKERLTVETNLEDEYQIVDPTGRCVLKGHLAVGQNHINTANLASGWYVFKSSTSVQPVLIQP